MVDTVVRVTRKMILAGYCGDIYSCPVAQALAAAYPDSQCGVWLDWGQVYLEVDGRHLLAPGEVREWVHQFDDLGERERRPPRRALKGFKGITFTLPPFSDGEWLERCYQCEELKDPAEIDDEGVCPDCLDPPAT